ncbi:MAG: Gfo/Idh/MocA family oxidoreductase [Phycisphaerae bacterium]
MKKAVLGLIGAGHLANAQHLPNLMYTPNAFLKTVCDVREDAVKAAQEKYRIPSGTTDFRKVLADPEIQGVLVVTQAAQHAELTIAALEAGKHVYVEKPLAESVEQCQAIIAAERKSGKHVAVGFNRRFAPAYRKAKELLDANGGGFNFFYRISDTYSYTWGKDLPPGVRVFHETCHIFDILRWFTGSEVSSVYCIDARGDDEAILLKFKSGPIATIMSSGYSTLDWPKEYMEVVAAKGGLTVDNFVEMWTYGLPNCERRYRYKGHFHPGREWTQRYFYEAMGAEAMRVLYSHQTMRFELEKSKNPQRWGKVEVNFPETAEGRIYREFLENRIASGYDVDKGWLESVDHFAHCILTGAKPENAGAYDGLVAEQLANAVVESRKTGLPVKM